MQLLWLQLWRLDAFSMDHLLLPVEVVSYQPLGSLKRHFQQLGDAAYRNDRLSIQGRRFRAVSEEEDLTNNVVSLMLVKNCLHDLNYFYADIK